MDQKNQPGERAYKAFCLALGVNADWNTLPYRSQVAWFAVECRCATPPRPISPDATALEAIVNAIEEPRTPSTTRERLRGIYAILVKDTPLEQRPVAPRGFPIYSHVPDPSLVHIPLMAEPLRAARQSIIPAEMEHLDRPMMVGGAVFEEGQDHSYLRSRLTPGGNPAAAPLFSHIIGFPRGHVEEKYFDARAAADGHATIGVDLGDHPVTGVYVVSKAALRLMEAGEVVELVRDPGSYSVTMSADGRGLTPSELAERVGETLNTMLADLKASPGIVTSNLEPEPALKHITVRSDLVDRYLDQMSAAYGVDVRAPVAGPIEDPGYLEVPLPGPDDVRGILKPEPEKSGPSVTAEVAKSMGGTFTGFSCDGCGSFAMVRTGKCDTCQECGRTGGCG